MQANEDQSFRNDERRLSDVSSSFPIVQSANMPGQRSARAHDWCWEGDLSERREGDKTKIPVVIVSNSVSCQPAENKQKLKQQNL